MQSFLRDGKDLLSQHSTCFLTGYPTKTIFIWVLCGNLSFWEARKRRDITPSSVCKYRTVCRETKSGMIERCCVASGTLCTQCRAQGRPVYGTLTLSTMLSPWGVRLLGLWDRGAKRDRHLLLGAFHSRQVRVLCWDTWTGRNSSLGIRHSPGQVEDMEVWTTWLLSVHIEIHELMCIECTSKFKPGVAPLPTGLALTTESPLWLERKGKGKSDQLAPLQRSVNSSSCLLLSSKAVGTLEAKLSAGVAWDESTAHLRRCGRTKGKYRWFLLWNRIYPSFEMVLVPLHMTTCFQISQGALDQFSGGKWLGKGWETTSFSCLPSPLPCVIPATLQSTAPASLCQKPSREGIQQCQKKWGLLVLPGHAEHFWLIWPHGHGLHYPNLAMPYPKVEMPPMLREVLSHKDLDSCFSNPPCFYYFWRLSKGVKHVHLTPAEIQQIPLLQKMYLCNYKIIFNLPHPMTHILLMSRPGGVEDRYGCSLLCSTFSFSSAAFLQ